jgi:hypothetical protein
MAAVVRRNGLREGRFGMQKQAWAARYVRWLYELLLSVYFVLMFMWTASFYYFVLRVGRLPMPLLRLTRGVFSSDPSFNLQYLAWFLLSGITFIVLRSLGQVRPLKTFLCQLVGSAVFLVPLFGMMPVWATRPSWWNWLWVEGAVAAGAALLYANRGRPATGAFLAAAALLHFGLWGLVYFPDGHWWGYRDWPAEAVLLPLLGSLAWGFYVWLLAPPIRHNN